MSGAPPPDAHTSPCFPGMFESVWRQEADWPPSTKRVRGGGAGAGRRTRAVGQVSTELARIAQAECQDLLQVPPPPPPRQSACTHCSAHSQSVLAQCFEHLCGFSAADHTRFVLAGPRGYRVNAIELPSPVVEMTDDKFNLQQAHSVCDKCSSRLTLVSLS